MASKKKPTEQELKDRLWQMVLETDIQDGENINDHIGYDSWEDDFVKVMETTRMKVSGFEGSAIDLQKIRAEVDRSCLTEACKKSLLDALSSAKKPAKTK